MAAIKAGAQNERLQKIAVEQYSVSLKVPGSVINLPNKNGLVLVLDSL